MIFVTVGTQLPFPRLIEAMDAHAAATEEDVIAQVGPAPGEWPHLDVRPHLAPAEFDVLFARARVVVGHAGIGTILTARRHGRPLVVLPRRHAFGEHRNDHQLATAQQVTGLPGLHVAWETADLPALLSADLTPAGEARGPEHARLLDRVARFLAE